MSKAPLVVTLFLTIAAGGALLAIQGPGRGGSPTDANGECPAGMTEVRPGNCQAPSQPPPSIVDYRPIATLVTGQHPVPRAKFPVIDVHGHPPNLTGPDAVNLVVSFFATTSGTINALGWTTVLIYLCGAAGAAYFLTAGKAQQQAA